MKAITLRDIPEPVRKRIELEAKRTGKSLNKTVIDLLVEDNSAPKSRTYHDLDHLIGIWSDEEAEEFNRVLKEQRTVDPELWK
jgi:hypothetical protein